MWSNYHTHSRYCDGKSNLTDYVDVAGNVVSLGFSSHAPLPFACGWSMKKEELPSYLAEIDRIKKSFAGFEVYASLEIDFIPGLITPADYASQLDYTIGSIHFVEKLKDGTPWEIDGLHTNFLSGLNEIFKGNIREAIVRYFELTREMIRTSPPTIVGHLDKIKIQNPDNKFFSESDSWYKNEVTRTLDLIQEAGCIIEINTRGLYQKKSTTPYPSPWIIEQIYSKNIPITLNSDAHHKDDVTNYFNETALLLHTIGFRKMSILKEGRWQHAEFKPYGLVL